MRMSMRMHASFWFLSPENVEMVLKILDGLRPRRSPLGLTGGLTNVATVTTVTDTSTGNVRVHRNHQHTAFQPIPDTMAFSACP
jgi:hypothetical protein